MIARRLVTAALAIPLAMAAAVPIAAADEALRLRQLHVIVAPDPQSAALRVVEIAIVQNDGTSPVDATIRFPLPADAYDLDLGAGFLGRAAAVPGGIEYSGPLAPGPTQLVLGYRLDYGGVYLFRKLLSLRADAVDVLIEDAGFTVQSRELSGPASVTMGEARFLRLIGRDVPAGTIFSVEIRGKPGGSAASALSLTDAAAPVGLVVLAGVTALVLIRPRIRRRGAPQPTREEQRERRREEHEDGELTEEQLEEEGALA
ncbi:MAG: hypothetical protein HYU87_06055 [Chloroflexi bacterium]|nr:hypothetical protein [Chloroflexota bacterium]